MAHQSEMADAGIPIALGVPAPRIYPIAAGSLTTSEEMFAHGPHTSGEVEIVVVEHDSQLYIGVGSDHTDRDLEQTSIVWSKQVCPNIVAPCLWSWPEIAGHWDECQLELDVDGSAYQRLPVRMFLPPPRLVEVVRERASVPSSGVWVFGGTGPTIGRQLVFGTRWSFSLVDPRLGRRLEHHYEVTPLLDELQPDYRVPLFRRA